MRIPQHKREEVFERLESFRSGDMPWRDGSTWAYIYDPGREAEEVIKGAFVSYLTENGLDPSALRMENDVVDMAAAHLHGEAGIEGTALPGRMAEINEALNALPVPLRERVLVTYLNELFRRPEVSDVA